MRALGGGELVIKNHNDSWAPMRGFRYESIKPLLETLPYVTSVEYNDEPEGITHDNTNWREPKGDYLGWREHTLLSDVQAEYWKVKPDYRPWIKVEPDPSTAGRVICNRTTRYLNFNFPWRRILKRLGERALFVGTDLEYATFVADTGFAIQPHHTENLLEVARAIKGSDMIVCEQSCPWWIAFAMRHPCVRSTSLYGADGIYSYPGALYPPRSGYIDMKVFDKK